MARALVVFDLDRTLTRRGTYTPFLLFAALRLAPWRLLFVPVAGVWMLAYSAKLVSRDRLKEKMLALLLGRPARAELMPMVEVFVSKLLQHGCHAPGLERLREAAAAGHDIMIATASFDFYVTEIARQLDVGQVVATTSVWSQDRLQPLIDGKNCYGAEKRRRIEHYLGDQVVEKRVFYSDHPSDEPTFSWADEAVAINPGAALMRLAQSRNWKIEQWR
jgi:HAD superfamily hydrolase (TIGR01490 family)